MDKVISWTKKHIHFAGRRRRRRSDSDVVIDVPSVSKQESDDKTTAEPAWTIKGKIAAKLDPAFAAKIGAAAPLPESESKPARREIMKPKKAATPLEFKNRLAAIITMKPPGTPLPFKLKLPPKEEEEVEPVKKEEPEAELAPEVVETGFHLTKKRIRRPGQRLPKRLQDKYEKALAEEEEKRAARAQVEVDNVVVDELMKYILECIVKLQDEEVPVVPEEGKDKKEIIEETNEEITKEISAKLMNVEGGEKLTNGEEKEDEGLGAVAMVSEEEKDKKETSEEVGKEIAMELLNVEVGEEIAKDERKEVEKVVAMVSEEEKDKKEIMEGTSEEIVKEIPAELMSAEVGKQVTKGEENKAEGIGVVAMLLIEEKNKKEIIEEKSEETEKEIPVELLNVEVGEQVTTGKEKEAGGLEVVLEEKVVKQEEHVESLQKSIIQDKDENTVALTDESWSVYSEEFATGKEDASLNTVSSGTNRKPEDGPDGRKLYWSKRSKSQVSVYVTDEKEKSNISNFKYKFKLKRRRATSPAFERARSMFEGKSAFARKVTGLVNSELPVGSVVGRWKFEDSEKKDQRKSYSEDNILNNVNAKCLQSREEIATSEPVTADPKKKSPLFPESEDDDIFQTPSTILTTSASETAGKDAVTEIQPVETKSGSLATAVSKESSFEPKSSKSLFDSDSDEDPFKQCHKEQLAKTEETINEAEVFHSGDESPVFSSASEDVQTLKTVKSKGLFDDSDSDAECLT